MMLRDAELKALYPALIVGGVLPADPDAAQSPVQPSSIDLTIGNIYVPETAREDLGGVLTPRREHTLGTGETAVVVTAEQLAMPADIAAIGFPPSAVAEKGLLTTNPGHVDPGFRGRLSFTVINMGRLSFDLRRGDRIVTLVFFRLQQPAEAPYSARHPQGQYVGPPVRPERLDRLAKDMLNVTQRAEAAASTEEHKTQRRAVIIPVAIAAIAVVSALSQFWVDRLTDLTDVKQRVERVEDVLDTSKLETRVSILEEQLSDQTPTTVSP